MNRETEMLVQRIARTVERDENEQVRRSGGRSLAAEMAVSPPGKGGRADERCAVWLMAVQCASLYASMLVPKQLQGVNIKYVTGASGCPCPGKGFVGAVRFLPGKPSDR